MYGRETGRFRFTLWRLLMLITVAVLFLGIIFGWLRRVAKVRSAGVDDAIYQRYFGIENHDVEIENVAVVSGRFTEDTTILTALFSVKQGRIQPLSGVGVKGDQESSTWGEDTAITIALVYSTTPKERLVQLGTAGHTSGYYEGEAWPVSFPAKYSKAISGSFSKDRHIIYAQGDKKMVLNNDMTLNDFATKNKTGNFLVVTVVVHW